MLFIYARYIIIALELCVTNLYQVLLSHCNITCIVNYPFQESIARNCVSDNPFFLPHSPGIGEVIIVPNKVL